MSSKPFDILSLTLTIVGAIVWGLIGFFNFNLVDALFGYSWISRIIYALVGLSGLYCLTLYGRIAAADSEMHHEP